MIRTALIAYGFSAQTFHLPFILQDNHYQLTHIVSSKADSVKLDFPNIPVLSTYQELNPDQIDLVVITTLNDSHYAIAEHFLSANCHVVVEKPFVLKASEAQSLADLANAKGKQLAVFQNRRWDGDFLTVQALIDASRVGQVKRFTSRFDRFRPEVRVRWREQPGEGTGILWDLGPHLIDQAVALFGAPSHVQARLGCLRDGAQVVDNFDLWFDYDGFEVSLGSSSFQAGPNARFLLEGTEGTFIKYGLDVQEDALRAGADVQDERWGQETDDAWGILYGGDRSQLITTKPGNYAAFWHQLAKAIEDGSEPPVPLDDAVLVIRLLELAISSSEQGKKLSV